MSRFHFFILVLLVSISGFSQGMLLPVISIIFETNGESAAINGLHATGLYIGVLLASPFMEAPLRKLGFKPLIVIGRKHCHFKLIRIYLASVSLGLVPASPVHWNRRPHASLFYANVGDLHVIKTKSRKKPVYLRAFLWPWLCRRPVHGAACQAESVASFYRVRLHQSVCVAFCFLSTKCIPGNQSS